jgi:putative peptidoglycan lipid II flippase
MSEKASLSQPFLSGFKGGPVSEQKAMARAAGVVGVWTTASRVLGFVRDMVIALFLGAGMGADAFFVAFRIPNLLRRLFAEGALSAAFIPTYVETLHKQGRAEAEKLARTSLTFTSIILALVTILGIVFSPLIVRVTAPGFFDEILKFDLTVELNRIMFPYIFFISLVALASGVLNSMGHFAAPAAAPLLLNISMILSVVAFGKYLGVAPFYALAWGVVAAGVLQLVLQLPFLWAKGIKLRPNFDFRQPALKRIGALFIPAALGGAVYQINVVIGTILASMLPTGSVSWLYYADRLVELPLGVFAVALGTAVLPSMSRQASNGDMPGLTRSVSFSLRIIAFFTIPASVALIALNEPIVAVLFQRGKFMYLDTQQTVYALTCYTVGLWAFSGLKVVTQGFFSLKDTKTPLWVSVIAVISNLALGLILMGPMAHGGIALATSIAAALNFLILFCVLIRRLGGSVTDPEGRAPQTKKFPLSEFLLSIVKICLASVVMGIALFFGRGFGDWSQGLITRNGLTLSLCIVGGLVVFTLLAYLLRCRELSSILSVIRTRKR